jgi:hypothetical protein
MKSRTRTAAWVEIVMWSVSSVASLVLGILLLLSESEIAGLSIFLFIACSISILLMVGWIQLLRGRKRVWLGLVIAHVILFFGSIEFAISFGVDFDSASTGIVMILYLGILLLSFLALITDSPKA